MKKLTVNRIAGAGLRANRRGYLSLGIGIFLSIFLISALFLCAQGVYLANEEKRAKKFGYADGFWLGGYGIDETLREANLFDQTGRIYVTGRVSDSEKYLGYYDETAETLMNRRCTQGRIPEKAGEIALEYSVLESLRIEAEVGDEISLQILPIDGTEEERKYTIVGVLAEQTTYLSVLGSVYSSQGTYALPSILVSDSEPAFSTGQVAVQYALTLRPTITARKAFEVCDEMRQPGVFAYITTYGPTLSAPTTDIDPDTGTTLILIAVLGLALALSAGVGISGAMEGQLARKTEEIGMLRAVGATKRQIRRVFGREAWLIAIFLSPLAVAAGCGFCALLSRVAPEQVLFRASPILLIPIFLFSALCVLLSASLPLRRASRVMPMSVLRDATLLRKSKGIKGKNRFSVAPLIAWRQNRLHPTRQIGAALMVALMCICLSLLTGALLSTFGSEIRRTADVELTVNGPGRLGGFFEDDTARRVTAQDVSQLAAIDGVESIDTTYSAAVNVALSETPSFQKSDYASGDNTHLLSREEYIDQQRRRMESGPNPSSQEDAAYYEEISTAYWESAHVEHDAARAAFAINGEKELLTQSLLVCEIDPKKLAPFVSDGRIDIEALDEGREVLAYVPDVYRAVNNPRSYAYYDPLNGWYASEPYLQNDTFAVGQRLDMLRAVCTDKAAIQKWMGVYPEYDEALSFYADMETRTASATVGALLKGGYEGESIATVLRNAYAPCLITTPKGAQALGLGEYALLSASIYFQDGLNEDMADTVTERVETIAMRGDGVNVNNRRKAALETEQMVMRSMAVFAGILVLFFCVSVAMITGSVTRRIRADARMIGTLRAVGADAKVIRGCYEAQVTISVLLGVYIGLAAWAAISPSVSFPAKATVLTIAAVLLFGALCFACCRAILALRVRETMRRSIVENIREL